MATKVVMEALSPTMEEGRLVKWVKGEGEQVKQGDVLAEVETDKAVMELVARGEGVLRKRVLNEGDTAPVGQLVGVIAAPDENIDALVGGAGGGGGGAAPAQAQPAQQQQQQQAAPQRGGQQSGQQQQRGGGGAASPERVVAETREMAGASPVPRDAGEAQGEASTPPQEKVAGAGGGGGGRGAGPRSASMSGPIRHAPQPDPATEQARHSEDNGGRTRSSPLARRMASERGIDLGELRGSGPGGRIIKRDIEAAATGGGARQAPAESQQAEQAEPQRQPAAAAVAAGGAGDFEDVALTQIRKTIARRLSESIGPIPTFYLTAEFDLEKVAELRGQIAAMGDEHKVSVNDVIIKAVAIALTRHPEVNSHWLGDRIRYHKRVHVGMAVATDAGLIVPVIFDADKKRLSDISRESKDLAKRARDRKLNPDEYTGSTFSVSNLGMLGIDQFTAIINPPEVGILAIGTGDPKPVVVDGKVEVRRRVRVTMSCDHRVIDGAVGARFLQTLKQLIENPLLMM